MLSPSSFRSRLWLCWMELPSFPRAAASSFSTKSKTFICSCLTSWMISEKQVFTSSRVVWISFCGRVGWTVCREASLSPSRVPLVLWPGACLGILLLTAGLHDIHAKALEWPSA